VAMAAVCSMTSCLFLLLFSAGGTAAAPAGSIKTPIQGLLDRAGFPPPELQGVVAGFVANVNWSAIQPTPYGPIVRGSGNALDQALAEAQAYNAAHPTQPPMEVKLRLYAGIDAPNWVKTLNGFKPVQIQNVQSGLSGTVGPFWTASYATAYQDLQTKLAAIYDGNPLLREVVISQCMTVYAEPFLRDDTNFAALAAQGYTVQSDENCLMDEVDAHKVWVHTHSSLSFNPYRPWVPEAGGGYIQTNADEGFTYTVMNYCRAILGLRCTLENNSIRSSYIGASGSYARMYSEMRALGPAITFQTAQPSGVGNLQATLQWAASLGANAVELPSEVGSASARDYGLASVGDLLADEKLLLANPFPLPSLVPSGSSSSTASRPGGESGATSNPGTAPPGSTGSGSSATAHPGANRVGAGPTDQPAKPRAKPVKSPSRSGGHSHVATAGAPGGGSQGRSGVVLGSAALALVLNTGLLVEILILLSQRRRRSRRQSLTGFVA
jgi:hypothetical protein